MSIATKRYESRDKKKKAAKAPVSKKPIAKPTVLASKKAIDQKITETIAKKEIPLIEQIAPKGSPSELIIRKLGIKMTREQALELNMELKVVDVKKQSTFQTNSSRDNKHIGGQARIILDLLKTPMTKQQLCVLTEEALRQAGKPPKQSIESAVSFHVCDLKSKGFIDKL